MLERVLPVIFLSGIVIAFLGAIWFLVVAFQTRFWWGLGLLVFPPTGLVFAAKHPRRVAPPATMLLFGCLLIAAPPLITKLRPIDLGPYERVVHGERVLGLTGWNGKDYRVIQERKDVAVLQMANADVDDSTLAALDGLNELHDLDLSHTKVTDAGLPKLAALPKLESLQLAYTAVTDAGLGKLAENPTLKRLDLRGTKVTAEGLKAWKDAGKGRRGIQ